MPYLRMLLAELHSLALGNSQWPRSFPDQSECRYCQPSVVNGQSLLLQTPIFCVQYQASITKGGQHII